mgnify:CR=1 FL=1
MTQVKTLQELLELEQQLLELEVALKAEREQRAAATARAELAEERERSHQDRWASDVYELRQEVKALKAERAKSGVAADRYLDMHREVLAARARIGVDTKDDVTVELDGLLDRVKDDEDARQRYLDLLEVMGAHDPRTVGYRKQLTSRLF